MSYTVGQRLLASQLNNLTPSGDLTVGDDVVVTGDISSTAMSPTSDTQNTSGTTTSASYTATLTGGTACGLSFVAPASGKIIIFNNSNMFSSGTANGLCTIRVRTGSTIGSGSDVVAASDTDAIINNANGSTGRSRLVTGLTPGSSYNVQQLFKTDGGTETFNQKHLIVQPQL